LSQSVPQLGHYRDQALSTLNLRPHEVQYMPTFIVSPGESIVTSDPSAVLETCLGSCIGVSLYDPQIPVGGIVHILLPFGSDEKEKHSPYRFATSGIKALVSEMEKMGAPKERTVAAMAGGAMILTDRTLSVEMNIGRRNSEMARRILEAEGIPIVRQDIGGNTGRLFGLNIATGTTHVKTVGNSPGKFEPHKKRSEILHRDLQMKIDNLKPLPETARKMMSKLQCPNYSIAELEKDIVKDQALTANVLKVCNSPHYGYSNRVPSIKRALVLMGLDVLKRIILSSSFYNLYNNKLLGYSTRKGELMKHSVCCGLVAELIVREKTLQETDVAFTAGLLHDIGKVVLDQYAFEQFNLIMDKVLNEGMAFLDAEAEILGYNHAQVGGWVAKGWGLPEVLTEAISLHHQPEESKGNPELVCAVHLADNICSMFGEGCWADALTNRIHQFAITTLGIERNDVERIVESLPDIMKQVVMI